MGSGTHIVAEEFALELGLELQHIPFEGGRKQAEALTAKQIMGTAHFPNAHRGGVVRPLVFLTKLKLTDPMYDDIPTSTELGMSTSADFFAGFILPAGVPKERAALLLEALEKAMQDKNVIEWLDYVNLPKNFVGPEQFAAELEATIAKNAAQLRKFGLID